MDTKRIQGAYLVMLLLACLCLTTFLGSGAARAQDLFPLQSDNSVAAALSVPDGDPVECVQARILYICGRNNPAFLVIADASSTDAASRICVVARCPIGLVPGCSLTVTGNMSSLPSGERCIVNPALRGYFDPDTGRLTSVPPSPLGFLPADEGALLELPSGPIPPSDPSLPDDGMGMAGPVTAADPAGPTQFDSVASLLASPPALLSTVRLAARPVVGVGDGFIQVGDGGGGGGTVKIYTVAAAGLTDRIIQATGVAHSENGSLVLYSGSGVSPFYDPQGQDAAGRVLTAGVGTTAYAATLSDSANSGSTQSLALKSSRICAMSVDSSGDGSWVYLTGRIVTGYGSYDMGQADPTDVYYLQSLDRMPGMRVWNSTGETMYIGEVIDVMAQLATPDGERILGDTVNDSSIELEENPSLWNEIGGGGDLEGDYGDSSNLCPLFMDNKALGGAALGYNPGVTSGVGLNNFGSRVKICGKVVGKGYCSSELRDVWAGGRSSVLADRRWLGSALG